MSVTYIDVPFLPFVKIEYSCSVWSLLNKYMLEYLI